MVANGVRNVPRFAGCIADQRDPRCERVSLRVNLQSLRRTIQGFVSELRRIGKLLPEARNHRLNLRTPVIHTLREALRNQSQHDRNRSRGAGRSTQQASNAAVGRGHNFGAELQHTNLLRMLLHDLHALPGGDAVPVFRLRVRNKVLKLCEFGFRARHELPDQVLHERQVAEACGNHRKHVVPPNRRKQVENRTRLQEFGAESGIRAKHATSLAVNHTEVEVRNRHGRRTDGSLAVDLSAVCSNNLGVIGAQELATNGETAKAADLLDARLLQQVECVAAGADENKASSDWLRWGTPDVMAELK